MLRIDNIESITAVMPAQTHFIEKPWFNMLSNSVDGHSVRCSLFNESYGMAFDKKTGNIISRPPEVQMYVNNRMNVKDVIFPILFEEFNRFRMSSYKGINKKSMQMEVFIADNLNYMEFLVELKTKYNHMPFFIKRDNEDQYHLIGSRELNTGEYHLNEMKTITDNFGIPY